MIQFSNFRRATVMVIVEGVEVDEAEEESLVCRPDLQETSQTKLVLTRKK